MLSIGIRFGEGFDRYNVLKLMQEIPSDWNYDFLVIGSSPGGIACAREASRAGKKTAIIKWRKYSAAEEDGFDDDLHEMTQVLADRGGSMEGSTENISLSKLANRPKPEPNESKSVMSSSKPTDSKKSSRKASWSRKVRESRLDLNNELYKRGKEGRRLMLKAATIQNSLKQAINFGWRIYTPFNTITINWKKMSELVMDYIMKENWMLVNTLAEEGVEILEGKSKFVDHHTVKIRPAEGREYEVTADIICAAPSAEYVLPHKIPGAQEYGITCDDFLRLCEPPGKTLIVGGTAEALECAAIVACFRMPVVVICRADILKGYDSQMTHMIIENLKEYGVTFRERTAVASIKQLWRGKLLTELVPTQATEDEFTYSHEEEFDTVVFANETQVYLDDLNLEAVGIELDPYEHKICTDNQNLASAPNIYVVGDAVAFQPQSSEISETVGRLLGKRLFWEKTETMEYSMVPYIIITPIEYAFAGVSEDGALYRLLTTRLFGKECIDVIQGTFIPVELIGHPQEYQSYVKAIIYKPKNLVIGIHMFGPEAGEVIQGFASAIRLGMTVNNLETLVAIPATKAHKFTTMRYRQIKDDE